MIRYPKRRPQRSPNGTEILLFQIRIASHAIWHAERSQEVEETNGPLVALIRRPIETLVGEMDGIVSQGLQEINRLGRDAHVGQEFHRRTGSKGWTVSSASHAAYCRA